MIDIKELRRLAEAATPGPWRYREDDDEHAAAVAHEHGWVDAILPSGEQENKDAEYIASANPSAILSLLDHIEQQEAEIARLRKDAGNPEAYLHECVIDERINYGLSFLPGVSAVFPDECDEFKVKVTPLYPRTSSSIVPDTPTQGTAKP